MSQKTQPDEFVLITSLGADRPGIVEGLSAWILCQQGNIEDSQMSQLGGEFATLILVSGPDGLHERLRNSQEQVQQELQLTIITKPVSPQPALPEKPVLRYRLQATALDHAGIVHQISRQLSTRNINIISASTHTTPAPFTGSPVFHFSMLIDIPSTVAVKELRAQLEELGEREQIDFNLQAAGH